MGINEFPTYINENKAQMLGFDLVVEMWKSMMKEYSEYYGWEDALFLNNSPSANIALLSAAAWKSGGYSLANYLWDNMPDGDVDLWIKLPHPSHEINERRLSKAVANTRTRGINLQIEQMSLNTTKHGWGLQAQTGFQDIRAHATSRLEALIYRDNRDSWGSMLGVGCFLITKRSAKNRENPGETLIALRAIWDEIKSEANPDLLAAWFPSQLRKSSHPGVFLVIWLM